MNRGLALALVALTLACGSRAALDTGGTARVPGGAFWAGSDLDERGQAIEDAAHGAGWESGVEWVRAERQRQRLREPLFWIMVRPVTNTEYLRYIEVTGAPEPWVDPHTWRQSETGFGYQRVRRVAWRHGGPTRERAEHPVVLVSHDDAARYCSWWGQQRGGRGRLPSETQWEKAARGTDGRAYPWGDSFDASRANTLESRRGGTSRAGAYSGSASPYGVLDMAGNVLEWTRTAADTHRFIVKGGAYSSDAASTRAAARHARPASLRHVAVGFRCVLVAR